MMFIGKIWSHVTEKVPYKDKSWSKAIHLVKCWKITFMGMSSFSHDCFVFFLRYTKVKLDVAILPGVHVTGVVRHRE